MVSFCHCHYRQRAIHLHQWRFGSNSIPHSGPLGIRTAFRIGRDYEGRIQYWDGAMDDFRIYGRGLNQYEVDDLFSDMSDMVDLDAGLVAHYPILWKRRRS